MEAWKTFEKTGLLPSTMIMIVSSTILMHFLPEEKKNETCFRDTFIIVQRILDDPKMIQDKMNICFLVIFGVGPPIDFV